ncbi:ribonuclease P protein subunit RPP40 [Acrasis kona]|uniref:Ribonuclease P protein subunit RPP40 n=1 Tax=Acrasis kona TaxID=1008807 RepID=A0AAW2Z7Z0_9EUKA
MQNFGYGVEPPKSHIDVVMSSFDNPKSSHMKTIYSHPFNMNVNVYIPDVNGEDEDRIADFFIKMNKEVKKQIYYICDAEPTKLVEACQTLLKQRNIRIYAHSVCTNNENANVMCIYPSLKVADKHDLVMKVNKDTYQELGLEGQLTGHNKHDTSRVIKKTLPMKPPSIKNPDVGEYARLMWAFGRAANIKFLICAYDVSTGNYIELDDYFKGSFKVLGSGQSVDVDTFENVTLPSVLSNHVLDGLDEQDKWYQVENVVHWLGMVSSGMFQNKDVTKGFFRTVLDCEESCHSLHIATFRGFLSPHLLQMICEETRNNISEGQWCAVIASGAEDSPMAFGLTHGHGMSAENDLALVMFKRATNPYWMYKCMGSQEQTK